MNDLYLGMISGTSVDGVDAVLCELNAKTCRIVRAKTSPFTEDLQAAIQAVIGAQRVTLSELGSLDTRLGEFFAKCAVDLISEAGLKPVDVTAIGHHGQTIFHEPSTTTPFTLQIGDPNIVAARTGITTVADFRRLDMAYGGQGAPLVPIFHEWLFADDAETRVVLNIGGIANVTVLTPGRPTEGFDTGPGNCLLDVWIRRCLSMDYDEDGAWGAQGNVCSSLLAALLTEPYFALRPPKSSGRELFNLSWLQARLASSPTACSDRDVQATLAELTARTITDAVSKHAPECRRIIVCGGGSHNDDLMARLARLSRNNIETTEDHGIQADWIEGAAFAWLARARLAGSPGNIPTVTGAREAVSLGGVYSGATSDRASQVHE